MMSWHEFHTVTVELEERTICADVCVYLARSMYGADADGRRGEVRTFVEDYKFEQIFDLDTGKEVKQSDIDEDKVIEAVLDQI